MSLRSEEVFPKVVVYKEVFKDINNTLSTLKENNVWEKWDNYGSFVSKSSYDKTSEVITELLKVISETNIDYSNKYNLDINDTETVFRDATSSESDIKWWHENPNLYALDDSTMREDATARDEVFSIAYKSDYEPGPYRSPGYKHVVSTICYFNDDYKGGGLDFLIDEELYCYNPSAGDVVVFPSGNPSILTTPNGKPYFHGVKRLRGGKQYFSKSFWFRYEQASAEWLAQEKRYGKELWAAMQPDLIENFYKEKLNKNGVFTVPKWRRNKWI